MNERERRATACVRHSDVAPRKLSAQESPTLFLSESKALEKPLLTRRTDPKGWSRASCWCIGDVSRQAGRCCLFSDAL